MPDRPSRDGRTSESTNGSGSSASTDPTREADSPTAPADATVNGPPADATVDETVQRRLREAYLNDEEAVLVVTGVRSTDDAVVVEMETPHGGTTHVERFPAPRRGSLSESEAFLEFLGAAGVSPLDIDGLIGERVPATYDVDDGWRIDGASLCGRDDRADPRGDPNSPGRVTRSLRWINTHRYWLLAGALIVGELAFVAVIILFYA
ncbi:hypothetical protein [Halorubrum sp. DTA46]|uniref:hypothetical protein n=1 Tax=Halorubrum sp. DTA46 TaxID=3402162 RepID=UPI003AAA7CA2